MTEMHQEMPLFNRDTAKDTYGEPVFNQWRVAVDAYGQMINFLKLTPEKTLFTELDRQGIKEGLERLATCVGQMDAGQRGNRKTVSFDEIPHVMARVCAGAMRMELSGALDKLDVDEGEQ